MEGDNSRVTPAGLITLSLLHTMLALHRHFKFALRTDLPKSKHSRIKVEHGTKAGKLNFPFQNDKYLGSHAVDVCILMPDTITPLLKPARTCF